MVKKSEEAKLEELKFEEALECLEQVVARMEGGRAPLEETLKDFETGMRLVKLCSARLGETEKKIEILMKDAQGAATFVPREEDGE